MLTSRTSAPMMSDSLARQGALGMWWPFTQLDTVLGFTGTCSASQPYFRPVSFAQDLIRF
jgi:hypothetical protein